MEFINIEEDDIGLTVMYKPYIYKQIIDCSKFYTIITNKSRNKKVIKIYKKENKYEKSK